MAEQIKAYIPVSEELLADHPGSLTGMLQHLMDGGELPPPRPEPPTPAGHLALIDALHHDRVLRAVVELHGPVWRYGYHHCQGCDIDGYEAEYPTWPCSTVELIAQQLGIDPRAEGSE